MPNAKPTFSIPKFSAPFMVLFGFLICHNLSAADTTPSYQSPLADRPSEKIVYQSPNDRGRSNSTSEGTSRIPRVTPPKSVIEISDPDRHTVWTVSEPVKIRWKTENIAASKSIRFFLAKDDMVVQELGSFENNSSVEGIELAKNVGSGDHYQVVGIELFPDNKFRVAKYATPYFSIRNPMADARKAAALARIEAKNSAGSDSRPKTSERTGNSNKQSGEHHVAEHKKNRSENLADSKPSNSGIRTKIEPAASPRDEFKNRKISYIKNLSFSTENISVSLWDHGRQDGDIVSIYLNGQPVVSKHKLTYKRKKVDFKLDRDKTNELFLYAHNLGKAPPNTVSIALTDGSTSEKIVLNSDLQRCEAVQIKVQ
ncbi:hypothetical protein RQM65_07020 [Pricia sp. S334]|uniref:Uncharacterized protein n=1 Tax=Pricia mediterranea TaxID=3076079 RepID=A0ABU3L4A5_9FLAO|nr:hypothetical protein [Pricia sp. S334]MDT7828408.1 hypothetical protein [Pricia sp. S334]